MKINTLGFFQVNSNNTLDKEEPSPTRAVYKKIAIATACAFMFIKFLPLFPISRIKDDDFVENTSLSQKFLYLIVATSLVRFKYYFAWTLADAMCNNSGIGYNGVDEYENHKWDKFTNVDIFTFEVRKFPNKARSFAQWFFN